MFCFYTNQSNLLLTVYELLLFCAGFWPGGRLWAVLTDVRLSCAMALYIWVTHLIYQFVLVPEQKRKGQKFADFGGSFGNICVHYLTPLLVVAQWLFLADKTGLSLLCAVWWLALPLAYTAYALLRATGGKPIGHTGLLYPYAFMDLKRLGWKKFLRNAAALWERGCLYDKKCLPETADTCDRRKIPRNFPTKGLQPAARIILSYGGKVPH